MHPQSWRIKNEEWHKQHQLELLKKQKAELERDLGINTEGDELSELEQQIKDSPMHEEAKNECNKEFKRLKQMPPQGQEYSTSITYIERSLALPWDIMTEDETDIEKARVGLEEDHYGLEKAKKRICEYLAVKQIKPDKTPPILCFHGPPGVGKTSMGQSIADNMGREFYRMSLGGVRDESEIRGHRRTYVGSMPGRILSSLERVGTRNPVLMLDEIDKLGSDHRGDPSSALLEALDPEQNSTFSDHYLNVTFDLSEVLFITTANLIENIPPALRDRMEMIEFSGYSMDEKQQIADKFLVPKQCEEHGLDGIKIDFPIIDKIIKEYTFESGVRNLEREIANLIRGMITDAVELNIKSFEVGINDVEKYLDIPKYPTSEDIEITQAGLAVGLAYSPQGGSVMMVECQPGLWEIDENNCKLTLSGNLGDTMKESLMLSGKMLSMSASYHIHVPTGGTPKDGPSAGITALTALKSAIDGKKVRQGVAMTGELTLRGKVLPVGGIKEKVLAAHRAGIKEIILPKQNEKDLTKLPKDVYDELEFHLVEHINEIWGIIW